MKTKKSVINNIVKLKKVLLIVKKNHLNEYFEFYNKKIYFYLISPSKYKLRPQQLKF
jgi:hypothetical protein